MSALRTVNRRDINMWDWIGGGGVGVPTMGHCSDGPNNRAVIQPNSIPDTEQVLYVTDSSGAGGCSHSGLWTVCKGKVRAF
jgi:hypothetical protein